MLKRSTREEQSRGLEAVKINLEVVGPTWIIEGIKSCQHFKYHLNRVPTSGDNPEYFHEG